MRTKPNNIAKLIQIAKSPIKILCKARDAYVRGMLGFSGGVKAGYGTVGIGGGVPRLPKSFSVNSSMEIDEGEFRRLLRLASRKDSDQIGSRVQYNEQQDRKPCRSGMKRSYSVGIGKIGTIDEDRACSFREDVDVDNLCPRSRSHAVRRGVVVYH